MGRERERALAAAEERAKAVRRISIPILTLSSIHTTVKTPVDSLLLQLDGRWVLVVDLSHARQGDIWDVDSDGHLKEGK